MENLSLTQSLELPKNDPKPVRGGELRPAADDRRRLTGRKFIFTTAQNNTKLHEPFWATLQHLAKKTRAKLYVAKCTYNKNGWQRITKESATLDGAGDSEGLWWDDRLVPHFLDEQVRVADDLVFCAELDILPTMVNPLNGLDNYTGPNSGIVPHTKMHMKSLATLPDYPAKLLYTTGACTLRNYIQRRAGQIADFNHVYGALWVEIDKDGRWYVRQLNADDDGVIHDLTRTYGPGWDVPMKEFGRPFVNLGDVHIEKSDREQMYGAMQFLRTIKAEKVFVNDLLDMMSRNHHNLKDPHFLVKHRFGTVEDDVRRAAVFLDTLTSKFKNTEFIVVRSNHDEALARWVRNGSGMDPMNLRYWHELNAYALRAVEENREPDVFVHALYTAIPNLECKSNLRFIQEDDSLVLRGIEFGMHGHLGPNGARGNPSAFRQTGRRANTGHTHSAGIIDGIWTAGVLGSLDMGYNKGPSSWSCSHIVTYPNGKRSIITQRGRNWRA